MGSKSSPRLLYRLRAKLTIFITIFIGLICLFIFIYFPAEFKKQKLDALDKRASDVSNNVAVSASLALISKNPKALDEIFYEILRSNELSYLVVTDDTGFVYKSYNYGVADKNFYLSTEKGEDIDSNIEVLREVSPIILNDKNIGHVYLGFSLSSLRNDIYNMKLGIGLISLIFFFGGLITVFIASSIITKPVSSMVVSAEKISNGDLSQRTIYKGNDELGVLANSFNVMAMKLEKANNQIENLNRQMKIVFKDKIGELNLEINQRRLAEFSLRQSEEQFRLLFELAPIGMVISSPNFRISKVNNAFCNTLGYSYEELINKEISELTYPEDQAYESRLHKELLKGKHSFIYFEKRFIRKDKEIIYAIVESVLVKDDRGVPLHFIGQVIDITERKKVEQELVSAKEKAEESDRLKSAFLAQMSHEIRTPLNIILNAIPLLTDEINKENVESDPLIDAVNSAGKRLLRTIDLILNLSSVQTGNYNPDFEEVNIDEELTKLVEEFKSLSNERKIKLSIRKEIDNAKVIADRYTLNQIFQNLIGNAIKYTLRGSVEVMISKDENKPENISVAVKDTGIGMSPEYISNLFAPFSQEDAGHKREFEGNGLGLALVKKYIELNKAEIRVISEKEKGSTFTVILKNACLPENIPVNQDQSAS